MRKSFTAEFNKDSLGIPKEVKSIAQLASEYNVQPNHLVSRKKTTLAGLPVVFADGHRKDIKIENKHKMQEL